jgi:phosphoribosyl 1,2-cyclic phosphodiesterase
MMRLRLWGVRGSIPTPGAETARYGGNTACVTLDLSPTETLILDAGTGIREFGLSLPDEDHTYYILLSHLHWDHIQGFPMFAPLTSSRARIQFISPESVCWGAVSTAQIDGVHFPIQMEVFPAEIGLDSASDNSFHDVLRSYFSGISACRCVHPGGSFAYRFEVNSDSLVYMTDNELPSSEDLTLEHPSVTFCKSATYLIHDAQYSGTEMDAKRGWGHSDVASACRLAALSDVKNLILFHHDPMRTDKELDIIAGEASKMLARSGSECVCHVAREGMAFDID